MYRNVTDNKQQTVAVGSSVAFISRGGFKTESLLGHITRKASPPLPSPPSPPPFPPLEVGPSNPARGSGGAL